MREIKGPTVKDLMSAPSAVLEQLPTRIQAMAEAVAEGDLAKADLRMDRALGTLHRGPGYRKRRGLWSWKVLVLWLLGLCALLLFWA